MRRRGVAVSHKDAPPESAEQRRCREFYTARGVDCGWGFDKRGGYLAAFARDAWAAWQEAQRNPRAPDWFPSVTTPTVTAGQEGK